MRPILILQTPTSSYVSPLHMLNTTIISLKLYKIYHSYCTTPCMSDYAKLICAVALEVAPIDVLSYHHVLLVLWTYCPMTTSPMALMPYRHQSYHNSVLSPTVLSLFCPIATSPIALLHYRRQSHRQIRYQAYHYYRLLLVSVLLSVLLATSPIALLAYHSDRPAW